MNRRGVSPVIATVLLIVVVIVLGTIIFVWAKGFLAESAVKGDRAVESSCEDVKFEVQIVQHASQCEDVNGGGEDLSAIDINNIGNIAIYGAKILQYDENSGSIDVFDRPFEDETITAGDSSYACLDFIVSSGDKFRIVPKLLAEKDGRTIAYTCPEKDGMTVVYT